MPTGYILVTPMSHGSLAHTLYFTLYWQNEAVPFYHFILSPQLQHSIVPCQNSAAGSCRKLRDSIEGGLLLRLLNLSDTASVASRFCPTLHTPTLLRG